MASTNSQDCTLCKEDNITNRAFTWCTECESFLCNDCNRCHAKIKSSKGHRTITVEEYNTLPKFIVNIKVRCEEHDEKYELYCSFHDSACCLHCITEKHNQCHNMKKLADVLTEVKSSASVSYLEDNLKGLKSNFEEVLNYLRERIDILQHSKLSGIEEIKAVRKSLNEHLDMLEKQMLDSLEKKHCELASSIKKLKCEVEERENRVQYLQDEFSQIKLYASDMQTYFAHINIQKSAVLEAEYIESLKSENEMKDRNVDIKIADNIRSILSTIKSFGDVTLSTTGDRKFQPNRGFQIQQNIKKDLALDRINPELKCTIKQIPQGTKSLYISGCQIIPVDQLLMLDYNNKSLLLFNSKGDFVRTIIVFSLSPNDLCNIRHKIIAVTCSSEYQNEIVIVDTDKNEQIKTIKLDSNCYGIVSDGEKLLVRMNRLEVVLVMDVNGNTLYRIKIPGVNSTRIAIFGENIYCTDCKENKITCYKNEQMVWEKKLETESMNGPFSIDVDGRGIVYVICLKSKSVIALSPKGTDVKVILSHGKMLEQPQVLHVDEKQRLLFVCDKNNGFAFLYNI